MCVGLANIYRAKWDLLSTHTVYLPHSSMKIIGYDLLAVAPLWVLISRQVLIV